MYLSYLADVCIKIRNLLASHPAQDLFFRLGANNNILVSLTRDAQSIPALPRTGLLTGQVNSFGPRVDATEGMFCVYSDHVHLGEASSPVGSNERQTDDDGRAVIPRLLSYAAISSR